MGFVRDLDYLDARGGQDGVEFLGELPDPVPDEEPEPAGAFAEVRQQVARLLRGPWAVDSQSYGRIFGTDSVRPPAFTRVPACHLTITDEQSVPHDVSSYTLLTA